MSITEYFKSFALLGAEWVMWILILLSLVSVAIMFERVLFFWGKRPNVSSLINEVRKLLKDGDITKVQQLLKNNNGVAPSIASEALNEAAFGHRAVDEAALSARISARLQLEKNLAYLGTVGNNAPFVGLFGTVIGIIQAFSELSENATGGVSAVMSGISEALVATAIGLLVAIPAVAAFNTFQRRIKSILGDSDALIHSILSGMQNRTPDAKE